MIMVSDTQQKVRALEWQAEMLERQKRELCLVLCNVPETSGTQEEDDIAVYTLVTGHTKIFLTLTLNIVCLQHAPQNRVITGL